MLCDQENLNKINIKINKIISSLTKKKLKIGFAESCTGGLLSTFFTEIPGISEIFECSIISYSNQSKIDYLGVKKQSLTNFGAVSSQVAEEMAEGLLKNSNIDIAISITGIAGPLGSSPTKPIGLVYISFISFEKKITKKYNFHQMNRSEVRLNSVIKALEIIEENI
jgi:PncC family amidohydrolase